MKRFYLLFIILLLSISSFGEEFLIFSGDALLGKEEVHFIADKVITKTELSVSGQRLIFTQTLTFKDKTPTHYQSNINGQIEIVGSISNELATFTVANQTRPLRGKGLYPTENNTFYLWSYIFKDAPENIIIPSQLQVVKTNYSEWFTGPFSTKIRIVRIGNLEIFGYFSEEKMVRLTIPLQNIDVVHREWQDIFRKDSETLHSELVVLKRGDDLLHGELNLPEHKAQFPVLLLLNGSGVQDRDNNSPPIMTNSLFKELSLKLNSFGIGTLRFDDRGIGKSTGNHMIQDFNTLIEDAKEALNFLRKRSDVSSVGILGHSEGGVIALILAATEDNIASLVLLATPSLSLDLVIKEQIEAQKQLPGLSIDQLNFLDNLAISIDISLDLAKSSVEMTPIGFTGKYLRDHMAIQPLKYIQYLSCPVLIIQGEADNQVLPYHGENLFKAVESESSQLITYPYLNHFFTPVLINNPEITLDKAFITPEKVYLDISDFLIQTLLEN